MTSMEKLKLLPVAALLIITPLLSTSLRFKYLYLIVNILIISVGAEAGLLSFFLQSQHSRKPAAPLTLTQTSAIVSLSDDDDDDAVREPVKDVVGEFCVSESEPTIFFIEEEGSECDDDLLVMEGSSIDDHELYHKSEKFIGNFYKQLKIQRQESRDKLKLKLR